MDRAPYLNRKRKLESEMEDTLRRYPHFRGMSLAEIKKLYGDTKLRDIPEEVAKFMLTLDDYDALKNAQEVYITKETRSELSKIVSTREMLGYEKFKMPFEEMIFTFEGVSELYDDFYIMLFKMDNGYYKYNYKEYPIYTLKLCTDTQFLMDCYFTPPMLPRIYIECPKKDSCDKCVDANIFKHCDRVPLNQCLKTSRTLQVCYGNGLEWAEDEPQTLADAVYQSLLMAMESLKLFYKKPQIIYKVRKERQARAASHIQATENKIIKLTNKRYVYLTAEQNREHYIKRNSPCEHIRRAHIRHLKNGKEVIVHEMVVAKGNDKKILKI